MKRPNPDAALKEDRELVDELLDVDSGLRPRELDFVESIDAQVNKQQKPLTDDQKKWAKDILERLGR